MKKIDLEAYLEELECSNCHHEGVQGNGGDAYVCPVCQHEGSIYENSFASGELLVNAICPECRCREFSNLLNMAENTDAVIADTKEIFRRISTIRIIFGTRCLRVMTKQIRGRCLINHVKLGVVGKMPIKSKKGQRSVHQAKYGGVYCA